jgi:hypothetical protein
MGKGPSRQRVGDVGEKEGRAGLDPPLNRALAWPGGTLHIERTMLVNEAADLVPWTRIQPTGRCS